MSVEEETLRAAEADLIAWGVLERAPDLQITRRFRGSLMRAAAKLQAEERAGAKRPGHPIEVSVAVALEDHPFPPGVVPRREHHLLLVGLQIASLPEAVRALLGS